MTMQTFPPIRPLICVHGTMVNGECVCNAGWKTVFNDDSLFQLVCCNTTDYSIKPNTNSSLSLISILLIVVLCVAVVGLLALIVLRYTYARPKPVSMGPLDDEQRLHLERLRKILYVLQQRDPASESVLPEGESG